MLFIAFSTYQRTTARCQNKGDEFYRSDGRPSDCCSDFLFRFLFRLSVPIFCCFPTEISGPQQGPAEGGHVNKRQKSSKRVNIFLSLFDIFRATSKRQKSSKVSKYFDTFGNFRAAPVFRPCLGGALMKTCRK